MKLALLVVLVLLVPASAFASPRDELPQLGGAVPDGPCLRSTSGAGAGTVARAAASGPGVRKVVRDAQDNGALSAADADRYVAAYDAAQRARRALSGLRRVQLTAVVRQLDAFARQGTLTVSRMPVLFLQLEQNTAWWSEHAPPAPATPTSHPCAGGTGQGGARVVHDEMVFQWYAGQGLQIQQLATAGRANALVKACIEPNRKLACDKARVRTALDGLTLLAVDRGGFRAWEYYFAFGGGRPPWISGLSQGTAIQALARGSQVLGDPRYLAVAKAALGAFERRPPAGVRLPVGAGVHYLGYSFAPGQRIFNQFLQALVGLYDFAQIADDDEARRLFAEGDRRARQEVSGADTGAWSRYQAGGAESDLGYHRLLRDFLTSMCDRTNASVYCATAQRFSAYLRQPAGLRFLPGAPGATRVFLTKISCVTLKVAKGRRVVAAATRVLGRGAVTLGWRPPGKGTYRVEVSARDLVNHVTTIRTTVRVR